MRLVGTVKYVCWSFNVVILKCKRLEYTGHVMRETSFLCTFVDYEGLEGDGRSTVR